LEKLWKIFEPYADNNFPKEFRTTDLLGRFWEMYLGCALLEFRLNLIERKQRKIIKDTYGPDLAIQMDKNKICWIEAVTTNEGTTDDKVPKPEYVQNIEDSDRKMQKFPTDEIILRLRSAIDYKWKKFQYFKESKIISQNDRCVIAINPLKIDYPCHGGDEELILKSLIGLGDYKAILVNGIITKEYYEYRPIIIKKNAKKAPVNTDIFLNDSYKEISAILYSCVSPTESSGMRSTKEILFIPLPTYDFIYFPLGYDFILIHNPYAINPISKESLPNKYEILVENEKWRKITH